MNKKRRFLSITVIAIALILFTVRLRPDRHFPAPLDSSSNRSVSILGLFETNFDQSQFVKPDLAIAEENRETLLVYLSTVIPSQAAVDFLGILWLNGWFEIDAKRLYLTLPGSSVGTVYATVDWELNISNQASGKHIFSLKTHDNNGQVYFASWEILIQ